MMEAQSLNDGMYSNSWQSERDAINQEVIEKQRWQNDYYYDYLRYNQYNPQTYQKVSDVVNKAQNGVRIEVSPNSQYSSSANRYSYSQAQHIKKANRAAEHRAWQEQRRVQLLQEAEQARLLREMEIQRKKEEKQRRYIHARDMDLQSSAGHYQRQHDQITYNVAEGYERTMNYQPEGTERIESQYIPSPSVSTYSVAAIVSKSGRAPIQLSLTGNETVKSTDYELEYEKELARSLKSMELRQPVFSLSSEEKQWAELLRQLSTSHSSALNHFLAKGNLTPSLITINHNKEYVFGNETETELFVVSPDGNTMTIYSFEEHYWDDDNLIQKIRQDGLKQFFKDSYVFNSKGGTVQYKDLKNMLPENITKFLPQIKTAMKLKIADNSTTMSYQRYQFAPQNVTGSLASLLTDGYVNKTDVVEAKVSLSGGGKAEMEGLATLKASAKGTEISFGGSTKFSALELNGHLSSGSIVSIGGNSYMFKIKGDGQIGAGFAAKAQINSGKLKVKANAPVFPGLYAGGGVQVEVKNITKKANSHSSGNGHGGGGGGGR